MLGTGWNGPLRVRAAGVRFTLRDARSVWWQVDAEAYLGEHMIPVIRQGGWQLDTMTMSASPAMPASMARPLTGFPLDETLLPAAEGDSRQRMLQETAEALSSMEDPENAFALASAMNLPVRTVQLGSGHLSELVCGRDGTQILLDRAAAGDDPGLLNRCVLHECIHARLHWLYLRFRQLQGEALLAAYSPEDLLAADAPCPGLSLAEDDCRRIEDMLLPPETSAVESALSAGAAVLAEGWIVLNLPRYVTWGPEGPRLTDRARLHPELCRFTVTELPRSALYKRRRCLLTEPSMMDPAELRQAADDARRQSIRLLSLLPEGDAFPDMLRRLMEQSGVSVERLSGRCGISERTLFTLRADPDAHLTAEQLLRLCIGLQLPPAVSDRLMRSAGLCWRPTARHALYQQIQQTMYMAHPADIDRVLTMNGEPALFGREA